MIKWRAAHFMQNSGNSFPRKHLGEQRRRHEKQDTGKDIIGWKIEIVSCRINKRIYDLICVKQSDGSVERKSLHEENNKETKEQCIENSHTTHSRKCVESHDAYLFRHIIGRETLRKKKQQHTMLAGICQPSENLLRIRIT